MNRIAERIEENPIIAAVRSREDIDIAAGSRLNTVFILNADIFNIGSYVDKLKDNGKLVLVHIDFIDGLGKDHRAIDYISEAIRPDGIISTKSSHIKYAKECGIFAIQRFFLVDSLSYDTTIKTIHTVQPDMIEVMPAVMPGVIRRICGQVPVPVIAGGLVDSKEDIMDVLKAGALAVSAGKRELWDL